MKKIHVECLPDETLVNKLGVTQKQITHHAGKSRVFARLKTTQKEIGLVDEDPGSAKCPYEKKLTYTDESYGITNFSDNSGNQILVLRGKLEDWIIAVCEQDKVDLRKFGLPGRSNELHGEINQKLKNFEKLIEHLLKVENKSILHLKSLLQ